MTIDSMYDYLCNLIDSGITTTHLLFRNPNEVDLFYGRDNVPLGFSDSMAKDMRRNKDILIPVRIRKHTTMRDIDIVHVEPTKNLNLSSSWMFGHMHFDVQHQHSKLVSKLIKL